MSSRIPVTPVELAKAILVWLRVMPKRVWRDLEAYERAAKEKRHDPESKPDPEAAIAAHIVHHMQAAEWTVTRPETEAPGSPPPWHRQP